MTTLTAANREFDAARKAQGFTSQAELDAFFAHFDHSKACQVCSQIAGVVAIDDGMQPVMGQCETGRQLFATFAKGGAR